MEMKLGSNKRPIKAELGMLIYDGPAPVSELPTKEEIVAYLRNQINDLFPEKPDGYIPNTPEIMKRLAEMEKEAGVSIGD